MERIYYPCAISGPDADGRYCVVVPGPNVNEQGRSEEEALTNAALGLQEMVDAAVERGEVPPAVGLLAPYRDDFPRTGVIQAVALIETA